MLEESGEKVYMVSDIAPLFPPRVLVIRVLHLEFMAIAAAFLCTIILKKYIQF